MAKVQGIVFDIGDRQPPPHHWHLSCLYNDVMKKQHVPGVKNNKKVRRSNNEESNRNYPGFAHRGHVYLYLKKKEVCCMLM
jgi:hypothetical protein